MNRDQIAETITEILMDHLPKETELRLKVWYDMSFSFTFGRDGEIHVDSPYLVMYTLEESNRER